MADFTANLRVVPAFSNSRPEESRIQEAAEQLSKHGFRIVRLGRFAVSVEANEQQFLKVLGVTPFSSSGGYGPVHPVDGRLRDLIDQVEMAPIPQLL